MSRSVIYATEIFQMISGSLVLLQERRQRVLDLVSRKRFVGLAELAKAVKVSESTLRRDLDHWDLQGQIKRIHGGAMFVGDDASLPALEERSGSQIAEKLLVAREAALRI